MPDRDSPVHRWDRAAVLILVEQILTDELCRVAFEAPDVAARFLRLDP